MGGDGTVCVVCHAMQCGIYLKMKRGRGGDCEEDDATANK